MRFLILIFLSYFLISCDTATLEKKITPVIKDTIPPNVSFEEAFRMAHDITDLKTYRNKSVFIARLTMNKRYNKIFSIELSELLEGGFLSIKEPVIDFSAVEAEVKRSLPFNQLCYYIDSSELRSIKTGFLKYKNDSLAIDIRCPGCLDREEWLIEIFDHGKYSLLTKDYQSNEDTAFINPLLRKVKISKKNNFRISY